MKPLALHVRTSLLRWSVVPFIVLAVLVLLLKSHYWVGSWPETGVAGQVPAYFLSIAAAGAAAWVAGSRRRYRMIEQWSAAAVTPARQEIYRLGVTYSYLLLPYLVGQAVAFLMTVRHGGTGIRLWFLYALMGALVMLVSTAWGWAVGRYLDAVYAAPTAVLTWLIFETFPGDTANLGVVSGPSWLIPHVPSLLIRFGAWAFFTVVLVLTVPRLARSVANSIRVVAVVVGAAALIGAVVATPGIVDRLPVGEPTCVPGRIVMCLWPEDAQYTPQVKTVDARIGTLPDEFTYPAKLYEYGLKRGAITIDGQTTTEILGDFTITEGHISDLSLATSNAIISETLKSCNWDEIRKVQDMTPEIIRRWVELHLDASATPDYGTSGVSPEMQKAWDEASRIYTQSSPEQQRAWVAVKLGEVKSKYCER